MWALEFLVGACVQLPVQVSETMAVPQSFVWAAYSPMSQTVARFVGSVATPG
jgi:hypothetical protein